MFGGEIDGLFECVVCVIVGYLVCFLLCVLKVVVCVYNCVIWVYVGFVEIYENCGLFNWLIVGIEFLCYDLMCWCIVEIGDVN